MSGDNSFYFSFSLCSRAIENVQSISRRLLAQLQKEQDATTHLPSPVKTKESELFGFGCL